MNDKDLQLLTKDRHLAQSKINALAESGVKFVDPYTVYIGEDVEIGVGTLVWPGVVLLGSTKIGENCEIESGAKFEDSIIGEHSKIAQNCKIARSQIGNECSLESSCYIADSHVGNNCMLWVNVSMYHAEVGDRSIVHRDSRIVWSRVGNDCNIGGDSNIESYCTIKYAAIAEKCKIGPSVFIEGEKFEESVLATGKRSIHLGHSCNIGFKSHIRGSTTINPEVTLINASISNSFIGKRTRAQGCRIDDSKISHDCIIEEGAYIHDNSSIKEGCEIARCEITRSILGRDSKAKHHGYIGDVTAGRNLNWGAGSVTGNYDGDEKYELKIGDYVFVGINCSIVSKSVKKIGAHAYIGAHTLLTKEVPPNATTIRDVGKQIQI